MADTVNSTRKQSGICHTCITVLEIYGTTESVVPWLCDCEALTLADVRQLQFSAGRYVGTAFKHSWQGAPKGKKILYRQNR